VEFVEVAVLVALVVRIALMEKVANVDSLVVVD
jgi:hypothetical protein